MKKNSQLHLHIETELLDSLRREAKDNFTNTSELCRKKLRERDKSLEILATIKSIERKVYSE